MKVAILHLRWLGKPAQRIVCDTVGNAVESAHAMCADLGIAPEGEDWKEKLAAGEIVRTSGRGICTMEVEESDFHSEALTSAAQLPAPDTSEPYDPLFCYLLMRSDVPSFVNGKAMAQSHHCGTAMIARALRRNDEALMTDLTDWMDEADGFGTCITLEVTAADMRQIVSMAQVIGLYADIINDPTYPIRDGDKIKTLSVDTCAFVFGRRSKAALAVKGFDLFP